MHVCIKAEKVLIQPVGVLNSNPWEARDPKPWQKFKCYLTCIYDLIYMLQNLQILKAESGS